PVSKQVFGIEQFQCAGCPVVQRDGQQTVIMSAAILDAVGVTVVFPELPRQGLWRCIRRRAAGQVSCATDLRQTLAVELYQPQIPNHPKSREPTLGEPGTGNEPDRRI